jgi:G patch domain-containing protein 1
MGDCDEEDYHFFGTPIEDDYEVRAGTYRKEPGNDAAKTRQLPVWKQVC